MKKVVPVFMILVVAAITQVAWATDWPQKAGNPQRTSYTDDSPQPPYELEWIYSVWQEHQEHMFPQVQAIVYRGGVFFGTKEGSFYRAYAEKHDPQIAWRVTGLGTILDTAAAADGKVLVASLAGQVHALEAATGKSVWKFPAEPPDADSLFLSGWQASPCIVDDRAFIGSRTGVFVALDLASGRELWRKQLPMAILMSAAANDGKVYVGCEDLHVRAFDQKTGDIVWTSEEMNGTNMMFMYPMVNAGKVVVRTWPASASGGALRTPIRLLDARAAWDAGKPFPITPEQNELVLNGYKKYPERRSMYVLDEKTGKEAYTPFHHKGGSNDGMNVPPAVDARHNLWVTGMEPGVPPDHTAGTWWGVVRIDPATGRAVDFIGPNEMCNQDEHMGMSVGGNIVFVHQMEHGEAGAFGAVDVSDFKRRSGKGIRMPLTIPGGSTQTFHLGEQLEYNAQEAGSTCFSISGNRFYSNIVHTVFCYTGANSSK